MGPLPFIDLLTVAALDFKCRHLFHGEYVRKNPRKSRNSKIFDALVLLLFLKKLIPDSRTLMIEAWTQYPDPRTLIPEPWSRNFDSWTLIPKRWSQSPNVTILIANPDTSKKNLDIPDPRAFQVEFLVSSDVPNEFNPDSRTLTTEP